MTATLDLVHRAQAGDTDAYGQIYQEYRDFVYRYIRWRVPTRELAEDLTQDTFVRALRGIGRWRWEGRDVGAWLVTIARNLITDHSKSAHQRRTFTVEDLTDLGGDLADTDRECDPEAATLDRLRSEGLAQALQHLTADQRECLTNRFLRQLSVAETAAVMSRSDEAVKTLTWRALQAVTRFLGRMVRR